jgi:cyclopropane-fatty-acyl-phospholipid synthase
MTRAIELAEKGLIPDPLIRIGIRRILRSRLASEPTQDCERQRDDHRRFINELRSSPIAIVPERANEQHYEVPARFFELILGPRLKYSCCYWPDDVHDLAAAEERSLEQVCERAGITDGMAVLDLGCGWGSLSLWIAEHYRSCQVTAVSNSRTQAELIRDRALRAGLDNVQVLTADMNGFAPGSRYDRIVSLEMFEHMRNWELLYGRIASWLQPDGRFFQHVFCHRDLVYPYLTTGRNDWMARHFFTGGMMPSDDLPYHFSRHLGVADHWRLNGHHYSKTLDAWLVNLDRQRADVRPVLEATYGSEADRWLNRWRLFLLGCSELFAFHGGQEWWVSQYLLTPQASAQATVVPISAAQAATSSGR